MSVIILNKEDISSIEQRELSVSFSMKNGNTFNVKFSNEEESEKNVEQVILTIRNNNFIIIRK